MIKVPINYLEGLIKKSLAGKISSKELSVQLDCSKRNINILKKKYSEEGIKGLIHKSKGRASKNRTSKKVEDRIAELYKDRYHGFNWTHFKEKLESSENIIISYKALYRILSSLGFSSPIAQHKNKDQNLHPLRERRRAFGELLQTDASIHQWFEGSNLKYALHGAIDDATGTVMGLYFDDEETLNGYYHMFERIVLNYGIPKAFYTDKRTVFTYNKLKDKDKTIENNTNIQFKRCCCQLGVGIISTSVPQAKGRIERLWKTLQSRLVQELALHNITTIKEANKFLPQFEKEFNKKFAGTVDESIFKIWDKTKEELSYYLSTQYERTIDNGSSFSLCNIKYQLIDVKQRVISIPSKTKINVYKTFTGKVVAVYNRTYYETKLARFDKKKIMEVKVENKPKWKPHANHPWRSFVIAQG